MNSVEVMGHAGTDPTVIDEAAKFAKSINMVPIHVLKEHPQYLLNNMLTPLMYGITTLYHATKGLPEGLYTKKTIDSVMKVLTQLYNSGKLGIAAGEGFYKYNK